MQNNKSGLELPARTHAEAMVHFRRPFAPGAIGFRAMMKAAYNGDPLGGAHVAAYLSAQSVVERLNAVVPGRWRQEFQLVKAAAGASKRYMTCRLIITLPVSHRGVDVAAVYEDVGELEIGSRAGLKALYSDARKRAAVAAGIGTYLYTSLQPVVLPIGAEDRQVGVQRGSHGDDLLTLSPATEEWLRDRYAEQIGAEAARRDLGEILAHGEPERGGGQGEAAEQPPDEQLSTGTAGEAERANPGSNGQQSEARGNGLVVVDFGGRGPDAA